ncbi:C-C motif chemokine 1 [Desmodus rotundus]|uniref:C-C motif chemokine 1 n=1 Tax=Desmodus rotundus TaxID=9430 RepID=UPI000D187029|nr:C-C motif chemokine 1 [Desmodus rotundus]
MKLIAMALVCLLVAGMWLQDVNSKSLLASSPKCCFTFVKNTVPRSAIQCYRNTSSSCSHSDGVIFKMKRGREICASDQKQWVKDYLTKIKLCSPM